MLRVGRLQKHVKWHKAEIFHDTVYVAANTLVYYTNTFYRPKLHCGSEMSARLVNGRTRSVGQLANCVLCV